MGDMGYGAHGAIVYRGYGVQGYRPHGPWVMGHRGYGVWATWAMGPMGNVDTGANGVWGCGAHGH